MPSVRISPGRLTALWTVIRTLQKMGGSAQKDELRRMASRTSLRSGGLPIKDGLQLALEGGFIVSRDEELYLDYLGIEAIQLESEDEPGPELLRMFLSILFLRDPPTWVAYWQGDPQSLEFIVPETERRLMAEVGLYPENEVTTFEGKAWWTALRFVPLLQEETAFLTVIGNAGEQLSLDYERQRLNNEGFPGLAEGVRWVAQESAAYGFDILSYRGSTFPGNPDNRIAIEVKSSTSPIAKHFSFYLSAHEWATALEVGDDFVMHFWDAVDPGPPVKSRRAEPIVALGKDLREHLPGPPPCGDNCQWESARIEIPLPELHI